MRFLHTADWHIGRRLHGFDLTEEQQNAFDQIEKLQLKKRLMASLSPVIFTIAASPPKTPWPCLIR